MSVIKLCFSLLLICCFTADRINASSETDLNQLKSALKQAKSFAEDGENRQAIARYLQAIKILRALNDEKELAITFDLLGKIYLEMGEFPAALDSFTQSVEVAKKVN